MTKEELIPYPSNHQVQDILDDMGMIDDKGCCPYTVEEIFRAGVEWYTSKEIPKDEIRLILPTEEQFVSRLKMLHKSTVVCDKCNKAVSTMFYPYGYDPENNDIWYIGICPDCEEVFYTKD